MKITWSAEQRRSVNTICTAPVQDCEKSEIPKDYFYFQPRYDIHRRHRNQQVIVINELEFRTTVLHSHGTSVSYIGLKSHHFFLFNRSTSYSSYSLFYYVWLLAKWDLFSSLQDIICQGGNSYHPYKRSYIIMHYSVYEWIWKS